MPRTCTSVERIGSMRRVLGLQADVVALAEEALDRRLLADERDDDLAVGARCPAGARRRSRPRGCPASIIESPRTRRTNSPSSPPASGGTSTYSSMFSSARIGSPAATWPTSGRPRGRPAADARSWTVSRTPRDRAVEQLDRARLRRIAPQQPGLLEVREVRVHRRRRGQADRLADVAHRRRIAVLRRVPLDEVEDLLLALRQVHRAPRGPDAGVRYGSADRTMCSHNDSGRPVDGSNARATHSAAPHAPVAELVDAQG